MTARELIRDIFSRPQGGVSPDLRFVTVDQVDYLRLLIEKDREAGALRKGAGRGFVWRPEGPDQWTVAEGPGKRNTITRTRNMGDSGAGMLF